MSWSDACTLWLSQALVEGALIIGLLAVFALVLALGWVVLYWRERE